MERDGREIDVNQFGQNNVMQLTFKWAYNAVESKQNSCTMPIPDTCN